jgi:hypothetical protein
MSQRVLIRDVQSVKEIPFQIYDVVNPISTPEDVEKMSVSNVIKEALLRAVKKIPDENPLYTDFLKCVINPQAGTIMPIFFPVFLETRSLTNMFIPYGISIAVRTSDHKVIMIKRSLNNQFCKGFAGVPAMYLTIGWKDKEKKTFIPKINLFRLVRDNVFNTMGTELGVFPDEILEWIICSIVTNNYPDDQNELMVKLRTSRTAKQIIFSAANNAFLKAKGKQSPYPAEKQVIVVTKKQFKNGLKNGMPIASAHGSVLCEIFNLNPEIEIPKLPTPDPTVPFKGKIQPFFYSK